MESPLRYTLAFELAGIGVAEEFEKNFSILEVTLNFEISIFRAIKLEILS